MPDPRGAPVLPPSGRGAPMGNLKTCVDGLQFGGDPGENELAPQNAFWFCTGLVDRENALKFAQR